MTRVKVLILLACYYNSRQILQWQYNNQAFILSICLDLLDLGLEFYFKSILSSKSLILIEVKICYRFARVEAVG